MAPTSPRHLATSVFSIGRKELQSGDKEPLQSLTKGQERLGLLGRGQLWGSEGCGH